MLSTIPNPHDGPVRQRHVVPVPPLCPISHNPAEGSTVTITYVGTARLLDIVALPGYVAGFAGSQAARDLEAFVAAVARAVAASVGGRVTVVGDFVLTDRQRLRSEVTTTHG